WDYPELGMRVMLNDRTLNGVYTQPVSRDFIPGTVPDRALLAGRSDLLVFGDGRAVLPTLPPRAQRLDVRGVVSIFEGERGPRVLAQVRVPGDPREPLGARWVVLDSTGRQVLRGGQAPGVSACDPGALRLAEFGADLPPGRFDVTLSVREPGR